ncbi:hypothetical protein GUITHDRAFT_101365 [Guillardia theta CCMP2712]|uniref:DNA-directed primase/polymerase protein n=1 Tax=Guillardia theta (strain CCMP2712) TaxID=905079 RepID=L1JXH7_GUITC|nr:hypothetical protein GUITHDRAFT_101365 [Guillardia theta CCMP2712]EKX52915.1 hypothetical protein GUITHDRAFT_101365 [Guillardia theta CCMP2712]|eukprot:XP_005839895.1 hypothetical protein GUITHDRAFT_101365 [Guillardia theta CCMP2712]
MVRALANVLFVVLLCKVSCQVMQSTLCPFACKEHPSPVFRLRGGTMMNVKRSDSSLSNDFTRSSDSNFNPSQSAEDRAVFERMKLSELHRALRERGLNTRGNKADLVERLADFESKQDAKDLFSSQELRSRNAALFGDNLVPRSKQARTEEITSPTRAVDSSSSTSFLSPQRGRGMKVLEEVKDVNHADYVFEVFATQADAFKFADARPSLGLQVYAQDKKNTGAKQYVAATYRGFWRRYKKMDPSGRHFAEIIREGSPCRLYFDLEFPISAGDNVTEAHQLGNSRVDKMLEELQPALQARYKEFDKQIQVLELDSCTDVKFSRHLIVANVAFKDNSHAGAFVRHFVELLPEVLEDVKSCVDLGVYTRNRCFRILYSSKLGKTRTFERSQREHPHKWHPDLHSNAFMKLMFSSLHPSVGGGRDEEENVFMHSLICFTSQLDHLLEDEDANKTKKATLTLNFTTISASDTSRRESFSSKSPFPDLDRYVCEVRSGAWVQQWALNRTSMRITFSLLGNRFCEAIGRQHKSNRISRCLDPDCANFQSPERPIPRETFEKQLDEELAPATSSSSSSSEVLAVAQGNMMKERARLARLKMAKEKMKEWASAVKGFSYDVASRGWTAELSRIAEFFNASEKDVTREKVQEMLEILFVKMYQDNAKEVLPPLDRRMEFHEEENDIVLVRPLDKFARGDKFRLKLAGFVLNVEENVWRREVKGEEVEGEEETVDHRDVQISNAETFEESLRSCFFELDETSGLWKKEVKEFERMVGIDSLVDLNAELILDMLYEYTEGCETDKKEEKDEHQHQQEREGNEGGRQGLRSLCSILKTEEEEEEGMIHMRFAPSLAPALELVNLVNTSRAEEGDIVLKANSTEIKKLICTDFVSGALTEDPCASSSSITEHKVLSMLARARKAAERSGKLSGVKDERKGRKVDVRVCGDELLVFNGYNMKERLRMAGFRWRQEEKAWALPMEEMRRRMRGAEEAGAMAHGGMAGEDSKCSSNSEEETKTKEEELLENLSLEELLEGLERMSLPKDLSSVSSRSDSPQPISMPRCRIENSTVLVDRCYGLKRFLRELGMAWNETAQAWTCTRSHAAAILNMSREEEVTADLVLEAIAGSSHKAVSSSKSKTNKLPYAIILEEEGGEGKSRILIRNSYDIKDRCRAEGLQWDSKERGWSCGVKEAGRLVNMSADSPLLPQMLVKHMMTRSALIDLAA